ncbi:hypothetical protein F3Y22_tig00110831pilonHSYRG00431 [Hibiscus syriacus]|uniref:NPH3 domain-containing protein n=1 Tax=Hibiscus syriacus TaxID=106335 RepID=A0A6A2ZLV0_HIBSY|nr:hypothetical protein F3Y22_tig00110831pilonHSYRG00431 [Hibiscus syriacus]
MPEHPMLSKSERTSICELIDCKKLSVDACMHAVRNERLPSRVVMQVVLFDQVRAAASSGGNTRKDRKGLKMGSHGRTKAAATNPVKDRDAPVTSDELNGALMFGNSAITKVKSSLKSTRMFKKVWSSKGSHCQTSFSDSSETIGSAKMEKCKLKSLGLMLI